MFYYISITIIFVLTVGLNAKPTALHTNEPERCCIPKQYSSQISTGAGVKLPNGTTAGSYGYYNFSYDSYQGMVGMRGVSFTIPNQQKSNLWIIENIKTGQTFTIDEDEKKCYKSSLPIKPVNCIPDTATYLHSSTYGYGDKQIMADTWYVNIDQVINYATVSRDGLCVPLGGHVFFTDPTVVSSMTTTDFVPKINDPSIFDIPEECHNAI
ncbi:unnamed protein product [Adineta steineri]|uniref:Uncharacterized protein n=1 Tax=Adineta steineri TaxID=433720 RepID=A0A815LJV9_9BILA|nr:unnamed protein product [Adineta steineri]